MWLIDSGSVLGNVRDNMQFIRNVQILVQKYLCVNLICALLTSFFLSILIGFLVVLNTNECRKQHIRFFHCNLHNIAQQLYKSAGQTIFKLLSQWYWFLLDDSQSFWQVSIILITIKIYYFFYISINDLSTSIMVYKFIKSNQKEMLQILKLMVRLWIYWEWAM